MALTYSKDLDTDFSNTYLEANGISVVGNSSLTGIEDRIEIVDGVARITLYSTDTETGGGLRSEIRFGTLASNSGEHWSTAEFMIDSSWANTDVLSGLGNWYPTPDVGEESIVKHVNIGLRLTDKYSMYIAVPSVIPDASSTGKQVAWKRIEHDRWYKITFRANLQSTATGWREVYLDRVPIYKEHGCVTAYVDAAGPHMKIGMRALGTEFDYIRMFVRNARIWSGNNSFEEVMGGVPLAPPQMLSL